jgi:PleD family two-component response regulator
MHGGIKLESKSGAGTTATFWIPFNKGQYLTHPSPVVDLQSLPARLQSEASVSRGSSEHNATSPSLPITQGARATSEVSPRILSTASEKEKLPEANRASIHVLVVEDNDINQQIALKIIKKLKFSVSAVWNGREALDYLLQEPTAQHPRPDIILMDVQVSSMLRPIQVFNRNT